MQENQKPKSARGGLSVHALIIPAVVIVIILYGFIVFSAIRIESIRKQLFEESASYIRYSQAYTNVHNHVGELVSQAGLYHSTGDVAFADRFCALMVEDPIGAVRDGADGEIGTDIDNVERALAELKTISARAVRLAADANGVDLSAEKYSPIRSVALTPEETGLTTSEEKMDHAARLLLGESSYAARQQVNESLEHAEEALLRSTTASFSDLSARLKRDTTVQTVLTAVLCLMLIGFCVMLYVLILFPLNSAAKRVQRGKMISIHHGLRELKYFSMLYDRLLEKKAILEDDLRQSARVDALTGLPNRLAEKNFISKMRHSEANLPTAVLSLDVNNLKPTNDTQGHVAGDTLLQTAASCIRECFGDETASNCFRTGGDEFVAILQDVTEAEVREKIARFEQYQRAANISVAVGYAYSDEIHPVDVAELFQQADKMMYRNKSEMKRRMAEDQLAMPLDISVASAKDAGR